MNSKCLDHCLLGAHFLCHSSHILSERKGFNFNFVRVVWILLDGNILLNGFLEYWEEKCLSPINSYFIIVRTNEHGNYSHSRYYQQQKNEKKRSHRHMCVYRCVRAWAKSEEKTWCYGFIISTYFVFPMIRKSWNVNSIIQGDMVMTLYPFRSTLSHTME